jgi:hypothetical protein
VTFSYQKVILTLLALVAPSALAAYDANGVALGAKESEIRKHYPGARCKALEWASKAADRRCDDARVRFAGVEARITFYLRKDAVQAFDVRFDARHADKVAGFLKSRYGNPVSEQREPSEKGPRGEKGQAEVYKLLWEAKGERAQLVAVQDKRRGSLLVWRGNFEEEIYRVR